MKVWVSLGSNLGNRLRTLESALQELRTLSAGSLITSSIYETPAWGGVAHEPFLNQVVGFNVNDAVLTHFVHSRFKLLESLWNEEEHHLWRSRCSLAINLDSSPKPSPYMIAEVVMICLLLIELQFGRDRSLNAVRWSSRTLDLDILTIDVDMMSIDHYQSDTLTIPHPRLQDRSFILTPWSEIAPSLYISNLNATVSELQHRLQSTDELIKIQPVSS